MRRVRMRRCVGVLLATLMSGAFGADLLAGHLADALHGDIGDAASPVSVIIVTLIISFFTLVLGELAPKRLALQRSERVSVFAAPVVDRVATFARPLVWLLSRCTNLVVRLLGGAELWAVVKADGYGHGLERVARSLADADALGVAALGDGLRLRAAGLLPPLDGA